MSVCDRCGVEFHCAMADAPAGQEPTGAAGETPCWCTFMPPSVPVPRGDAAAAIGCWCPACLRAHIDSLESRDVR